MKLRYFMFQAKPEKIILSHFILKTVRINCHLKIINVSFSQCLYLFYKIKASGSLRKVLVIKRISNVIAVSFMQCDFII